MGILTGEIIDSRTIPVVDGESIDEESLDDASPDSDILTDDMPEMRGLRFSKAAAFRIWVARGLSDTEAARRAGYAFPRQSAHYLRRSRTFIEQTRQLMASRGLTETKVIDRINEGLDALRTVAVEVHDMTDDGEKGPRRKERVTEVDEYARKNWAEIAVKMLGTMPETHQKMQVEVGGKVVHEHSHSHAVIVASVTPELFDAALSVDEKKKLLISRMRSLASGQAEADTKGNK